MLLKWALIFLIVALVAGALGFPTIAGASTQMSKILFGLFLVGLFVSILAIILFVGL